MKPNKSERAGARLPRPVGVSCLVRNRLTKIQIFSQGRPDQKVCNTHLFYLKHTCWGVTRFLVLLRRHRVPAFHPSLLPSAEAPSSVAVYLLLGRKETIVLQRLCLRCRACLNSRSSRTSRAALSVRFWGHGWKTCLWTEVWLVCLNCDHNDRLWLRSSHSEVTDSCIFSLLTFTY